MPEITLTVLDKFHPHIEAAIAAAVPANWVVLFIDENNLAARAAVLREADIAFVVAAPIPKELLAEARWLRFIQKLGAGIDAFAIEPPAGSELLTLDNTVVTSHLAGATLDNFSGIVARAAANAKAVLREEALAESDVVIAPALIGAKVE